MKLVPYGKNCYMIPRSGRMKVDALVYLNDFLYRSFVEEESLKQLVDAASLPGVYRYVVGMPDIHAGFGLPIGGVMAMDASKGLISAGAVGMDINCGVRLLRTEIEAAKLSGEDFRELMRGITSRVPTGVGKSSRYHHFTKKQFKEIIETGMKALVEMGFARSEDSLYVEEGGSFAGADLGKVSKEGRERGNQLSTIGGGNHFIELGEVAEIFDREAASTFGLVEGMLTLLIHTGSRGFGHQICTDYSQIMEKAAARYGIELPSKGLAAVPIDSPEGRDYLGAMLAAMNFSYSNRQLITYDVRKAFAEKFGRDDQELGLGIVYDVSHNIAKFERIEGKDLLVHRKGATRALPPGHEKNPPPYRETGHPVIIPGSMGTSSYVVTGGSQAEKSFYSLNHGAGRVLSRRAARKQFDAGMLKKQMKGILFHGAKERKLLDEAPLAYKDIDNVVETLHEIDISRKVARLFPLAVIKGEG